MRKLLIAGVVLLAGCSSANEAGPMFDDEKQAEIACMKHQPEPPGQRYLDEQNWDTDVALSLLRYYTANGRKGYCDGKPASDVDKKWLDVYVKLGADGTNLTPAPSP